MSRKTVYEVHPYAPVEVKAPSGVYMVRNYGPGTVDFGEVVLRPGHIRDLRRIGEVSTQLRVTLVEGPATRFSVFSKGPVSLDLADAYLDRFNRPRVV